MPVILAAIVIFGTWSGIVLGDSGFRIAPSELELNVGENDSGTASVYITSDFNGQLITGVEDIPFHVNPGRIDVTDRDVNKKVALTLYCDRDLEEGVYAGKVTFLANTGTNVAYGIKMNVRITRTSDIDNEMSAVDTNNDNNVIIYAVIGVLVALVIGIFIGRKFRNKG